MVSKWMVLAATLMNNLFLRFNFTMQIWLPCRWLNSFTLKTISNKVIETRLIKNKISSANNKLAKFFTLKILLRYLRNSGIVSCVE